MERERWARVEAIFHEVLESPALAREEVLGRLCAGDGALEGEVRSLLEASQSSRALRAGSALDEAAIDVRELMGGVEGVDPLVGARVGRYRVVAHMATGGMGAVYEAEQEQPRRRVALKLMRWGVASPGARTRFEIETEILGRLEHPGIARIYEAGLHEMAGHRAPYFAMEFVDGESITAFVRRRRLSTRATLELFVALCDAVHYAHTRGVIHRDLKPGNILIDGSGQPRVLDFGVARFTDADVQVTTARTDVGQLVGTVAYMSPEQASGDPAAIDTRSDVYSLGVLLYELLAGRAPYDVTGKMVHEAVRIVREAEPAALSSVNRVFRGDLDRIMMRALEKAPQRRYQSVLEFAADVRRYLDDEPVLARRPSAAYQLRKFARRHRGLVAGFAAFLLLLLGAVAVISVALARAMQAEAEAERQRAIAAAVNTFLEDDVLAAADPDRAFDPDVRLAEVLDAASLTLESRFDALPAVRASLHGTVGRTYVRLGRFDEAVAHLERALALWRDDGGASVREVLETRLELAEAQRGLGRYAEAEAAMAGLLEDVEAALGAEDEVAWRVRSRRALVLEELGRLDEAEREHGAAVAGLAALYGERDERTTDALNGLANLLMQRQRHEEAEGLFRRVLEAREGSLGAHHPKVAVSRGNLGELYRRMRRYEEAYAIFRALREEEAGRYGPDHPRTLAGMNNYALLCRDMGRLEEARGLFEELVARRRALKGEGHLETMISSFNLGLVYVQLERLDEASALFERVAVEAERVLGTENWYTGIFISKRAMVELERGDVLAAEGFARRAQEILEVQLEPGNSYVVSNVGYLWRICRALGRVEEAEGWLARVPEGVRAALVERYGGEGTK